MRVARPRWLPWLLCCLVALVVVPLTLLVLPAHGPLRAVDGDTAHAARAYGLAHPGRTEAMRWVTQLGSSVTGVLVAVPLALVLARRGLRLTAVWVLVAMCAVDAVVEPAKAVVHRARPYPTDPGGHDRFVGLAYPSGHSAHIAAYVVVLWMLALPLVGRRRRPWLLAGGGLLVLCVGGSRVALGAHYPTDVVAGWAVGACWAIGAALLVDATATRRAGRGRAGPAPPANPAGDAERAEGEGVRP